MTIASEFEQRTEDVAADLQALFEELHLRGLVKPVLVPRPTRQHRNTPCNEALLDSATPSVTSLTRNRTEPPSSLSCLVTLAVVSIAVRILGVRRIWKLAHGHSIRLGDRVAQRSWLEEASNRISRAATFCPLRAKCLERSLSLLWWARRSGVDAQMRLGVLASPFYAHAWVEFDGAPVNDGEEQLRLFRQFPAVSPEFL